MKTNILKIVKWFCRKLTYNELASAIIIFHEVLSNARSDIELKPEAKPPHYRDFRTDMVRPLTEPPAPPQPRLDWQQLQADHKKATGKPISPVRRHKKSILPPEGCRCGHCNAPQRYLYLNDGKKGNQVKCKICNKLSPTHRVRTAPCLALQYNTYGKPESNQGTQYQYVADGLPSYDAAIMAYNKDLKEDKIIRHKVVGLENIDKESTEFRCFKQIVERLNRTYKYHTRPRAGFKTFDGAVALTVLFVAFYNFMRSHSSLNGDVPVPLECLKGIEMYPQMWTTLLKQVI